MMENVMNKSPELQTYIHNEQGSDFKILNSAISSFNVTAQELEESYRLLQQQVEKLNRKLQEKNTQLEKNLCEKEQVKNFLFTILESLPTGVLVFDLHGKLLMSNNAVEKITGMCPSQLDATGLIEFLDQLQINNSSEKKSRFITRNIDFMKKGSDVRSLKVKGSHVIDAHGEIIGTLFIIEDQTRLKKLEIQSERDERLKAMGEIAIKIAHEVRNPLGSIELLASILRQELTEQNDLQRIAERINTEVRSLDNVISNLLLFTRPQQSVLKELNVSGFLHDFVEFIQPVVFKNGVNLMYEKSPQSIFIAADDDLLKQVFLNITLNAMQAMSDKGCISIGFDLRKDHDGADGNWVEIFFKDNGEGIPSESLNKVFHPFYTTKEKGTGLGLAIVHNIIESHGGTIEARSRVKKGTCFLISFPVLPRENEDEKTKWNIRSVQSQQIREL